MRKNRGTLRVAMRLAPETGTAGLTLIELIVAFSLMLILSTMALPVAKVRIQREKERRLRLALQEIRQAIDRHKDMADEGKLAAVDPDNHGYPESLEAMVEGVEFAAEGGGQFAGPGATGARLNQPQRPGDRRLGSSGFGQSPDSRGGLGFRRDQERGGRPGDRDGFSQFGTDSLASDDDEGPTVIRFLRSIPVDPMTGQKEWGLLSISDSPMSRSWSGRNVFDIYSLSNMTALDGTRYAEW